METLTKTSTRKDNSLNPAFRHTYDFHSRGAQPSTTTYTVFHGEVPELPQVTPKYFASPATAALASRHGSSPYSYRATAERVGVDPATGRATFRYGGPGLGSTSGSGGALLPTGTSKLQASSTFGSSGLPPVPYKSYLTEYGDEYREPIEHMSTLQTLTQKFNTTGGYRTNRTSRSAGQPKYESRVVAF